MHVYKRLSRCSLVDDYLARGFAKIRNSDPNLAISCSYICSINLIASFHEEIKWVEAIV